MQEMPDTCRREPVSHTYHVDGDAVVQSAEALESAFEDCLPVSRACGNNDIQLSLLQWSVTVGCCSHQEATWPQLLLRIFSGTAQEAAEIYVSRRRWGALVGCQPIVASGRTLKGARKSEVTALIQKRLR